MNLYTLKQKKNMCQMVQCSIPRDGAGFKRDPMFTARSETRELIEQLKAESQRACKLNAFKPSAPEEPSDAVKR
jgi:hypothetical protein